MKEEIRKLCEQFGDAMGMPWNEEVYILFERDMVKQMTTKNRTTLQIFTDMTLNVVELLNSCPELRDSKANYTKVFTLEKKRLENK